MIYDILYMMYDIANARAIYPTYYIIYFYYSSQMVGWACRRRCLFISIQKAMIRYKMTGEPRVRNEV